MPPLALLLGVPVAGIAAAVVYADTARRDLPPSSRLRRSGAVAAASLAGFVGAFGFDGVLFRLYVTATGAPAVVSRPTDLLSGLLVVGLSISAAAVLAYGFGSRYGPFGAA